MSLRTARRPVWWFWFAIGALFLTSLGLRLWGLDRLNTLVFDEVYFAQYARDYLTGTPFFDVAPPLSKYLIAIGIWVGQHVFPSEPINTLTGSPLTPWSYRWLNGVTGAFIPVVTVGLGYKLTGSRRCGVLAGLFMAADGLFLVESRHALNNVYLVLFGLLGQWCVLIALSQPAGRRGFWLGLAGLSFGATISVKWNGLWFLLAVYGLWILVQGFHWLGLLPKSVPASSQPSEPNLKAEQPTAYQLELELQVGENKELVDPVGFETSEQQTDAVHPLRNLVNITPLQLIFDLGVIPIVAYLLVWIPHLQLNPKPGLFRVQWEMLRYHQGVGSGAETHPYCSAWYTWPFMIRPVGYFYQTAGRFTDPIPLKGKPLSGDAVQVVYDVHGMGNPVLWWISTMGMVLILGLLVRYGWQWWRTRAAIAPNPPSAGATQANPLPTAWGTDVWVWLYLLVNYWANLLPWTRVTRCTFLYHYMGALVFAVLAIAWLVDRWLRSYQTGYRAIGVTIIFAILLAFVFWLPLYLGLPISPGDFRDRMWFNSWY